MATILAFQARPVSPLIPPREVEAQIILFPGVRYERRAQGDELETAGESPKAAET